MTMMVTPSTGVVTKQCTANKGDKRCTVQFQEGYGFVPDLVTLYEQVRGTAVDTKYPLTRSEVLSLEMCGYCGRDPRFKKLGVKTFQSHATLRVMQYWADRNARELEKEQQRGQSIQEQQHVRGLTQALRAGDKGFVRQTFAEMPHQERKPKRGRRLPAAERRKRAATPKVQHEDVGKKNKKGKQKNDKKNKK